MLPAKFCSREHMNFMTHMLLVPGFDDGGDIRDPSE